MSENRDKKLEDILRLIELCKSVASSSANPFEVNIREKLLVLKKHLPDWKFIDVMLKDSEALYQLVQIVKLQELWLKHRASSLYIDPMLLELKLRLLSKEELADSLVKSWHPITQLDQLTPRGLERAFTYWRDLTPLSERFREEFSKLGTVPGEIDYDELVGMRIFSKEQFDSKLQEIYQELAEKSSEAGVDYRIFVNGKDFEGTVIRAYLIAFLVTEGRATLRIDPLTEKITLFPLAEPATGETSSVAIEVGKA
ncbi:MAG: hypothetical protein HYW93_03800 [Thaumarchaeota archaeon]|nr:hypothetical protein [Nitrososphaerota archaeon]